MRLSELASRFFIPLVFLAVGLTGIANAQPPDLSDDINNPTIFNIGLGNLSVGIDNSVFSSGLSTGVTGNLTGDIDFFNVVIADGFQLDSIALDSFDGGGSAFIGFAEGSLGGNPALGAEQAAFSDTALGFALLSAADASLFDNLAGGAQGIVPDNGFDPTAPLGTGTFAFVFQNTGSNVNNFELTLTGSAVTVPEPSSAIVLALCGLGLAYRRR